MLSNHSPAPWTIEKYSDANTKDGERIKSDNGIVIVPEVWGASLAECDANYKLIAAAPHLLTVLKALNEWHHEPGEYDSGDYQELWRQVDAAIKEAANA